MLKAVNLEQRITTKNIGVRNFKRMLLPFNLTCFLYLFNLIDLIEVYVLKQSVSTKYCKTYHPCQINIILCARGTIIGTTKTFFVCVKCENKQGESYVLYYFHQNQKYTSTNFTASLNKRKVKMSF